MHWMAHTFNQRGVVRGFNALLCAGFAEHLPRKHLRGLSQPHLRPVKGGVEKVWSEHTVVVFPYMRRGQIGVPIDDTHTWHIFYLTFTPDPSIEVPEQPVVPYFEPPWQYENGEPNFSYITAQDELGWWSQGDITDRTQEHLGQSDTGIIAMRNMFREQLQIVEDGGEPMNGPVTGEVRLCNAY